jgi:hypothetical protein
MSAPASSVTSYETWYTADDGWLKPPFPWLDPEIVARFWAKVDRRGDNECWPWLASARNKGYGAFAYTFNGTSVNDRANRFSYQLHYGSIPDDILVCHTCDYPPCCNPTHLFQGTNQDNVDDMMQKGRRVKGGTYQRDGYERGEQHHAAKLTEADVRTMRQDHANGLSYSLLAIKYGVPIGHAWRIVNRKAWKHV